MKTKNVNQKGFGLIEIILVIGVGMATFLGIEQYLNLSLQTALHDSRQTESLYLAKSNLEQARAVRDEDWALLSTALTVGNQYSFSLDTSSPQKIIVQAGTKTEGRYTVWFTTSLVQRNNTTDNIDTSGINVYTDTNTLKVNSSVSWIENGVTKTATLSEYLVNFN
jgi:Tfp pilus assembly protein PilV